jgi:hypothetical protein
LPTAHRTQDPALTLDYSDDEEYVDISASAAATTRDLTDEELEELAKREKRRLPFGFQPPRKETT